MRGSEALDAETLRLTEQLAIAERAAELQRRSGEIEHRASQLDVAEMRLAEEEAEFERAREVFYREHLHWQEDVASAQHKLREEREQLAQRYRPEEAGLSPPPRRTNQPPRSP